MTSFEKPLNAIMVFACLSGFIAVVWQQWIDYQGKDTYNTIKMKMKSRFRYPVILFCHRFPVRNGAELDQLMTKEEMDLRYIRDLKLFKLHIDRCP